MSDPAQSVVQGAPSAVSGGRKPLTGWQKVTIWSLVAVVVVAFMIYQSGHVAPPPADKPTSTAAVNNAGEAFKPPPMPGVGAAKATAIPLPFPGSNVLGALTQRSHGDPTLKGRESNILGGAGSSSLTSAPAIAVPLLSRRLAAADNSSLGRLLKPTVLAGYKAALLPHPDLTITMGTPFPCLPQEPLNSDVPGLVTCIVPKDVRGTTGRVVLLDRGTKIVGTVQNAPTQGHDRLFVLWLRAETPNPNHVIIDLDSPAADQLGTAGLGGDVNTHFWQRFGGAIMLSFIDTGLQAAAAAASSARGSNSVNFTSFQSNGQNAAAVALQNTINIAPTITRDQALPATVFVARDLDFSDVYGLQLREER